MRVGFNSSFNEISRIIQASDQPRVDAGDSRSFGKLLSEISPDKEKANELRRIKGEPPDLSKLNSVERGPLAQVRFAEPQLKLPDLTRFNAIAPILPAVNSGNSDVKKPTVLEVKRVPAADELAAKSRPERQMVVRGLVEQKGSELGIDPVLSMAVVAAESDFNPKAVSADGHYSKGLFQLLDRTGKEQLVRSGIEAPYDPHDPSLSTELGIRYLRQLHNMFSVRTSLPGNLFTTPAANSTSLEKLAVAAYNAGEGRVAAAQRSASAAGANPSYYEQVEPYLPKSTQEYVRRVIASKTRFEAPFVG